MERLAAAQFRFGEFDIDGARRTLTHAARELPLKAKAFDLLYFLVENSGKVLTKSELLDGVWPGQFVEENNLSVQVSALRKALGEHGAGQFIVTIPGKGYSFVAEVEASGGEASGDDRAEVIIETRSRSQIVIEEEIVPWNLNGDPAPSGQRDRAALHVAASRIPGRLRLIMPIGLLLVMAGFGGWYLASSEVDPTAGGRTGRAGILKTETFATSGGVPHRVGISPDGRILAYVQRSQGEDSIWVGDLETNQSIQITPPSERLHSYIGFSPDSRNIYFTARDDNHLVWTLMRVSVYGGAVQVLTAGVHSSLSFSPDGRQFAFLRRDDARTNNTYLIIADAETGMDEQVLLQPEKPQRITSIGAAWSPDGKSVAVGMTDIAGRGCEITNVSVADGSTSTIGDKACRGNSNLAWLNDGSAIVITGAEGDVSGNNQVRLVSYPAGAVQRITNDTLNYGNYSLSVSSDDRVAVLQTREDPKIWLSDNDKGENARQILAGARVRAEGMQGLDVAPDGKLLYAASNGDSRVIWEMDENGASQRQLTPSQKDSSDDQVTVTADNRFIVFASNRSGSSEIWRSNRDGSSLIQLTRGGSNSEPALSPDGKWVVYTSRVNGNGSLWRISVEGGEPTQMTKEETSWPAVSPDGKYIACVYGKAFDASDKRIAIIPFDGGRPVKVTTMDKNGVMFNRIRWSPDSRAMIYKDLVQGLWRHDLASDKRERIPVPDDYRVSHFNFSPTGALAFTGVIQMREIVILGNYR